MMFVLFEKSNLIIDGKPLDHLGYREKLKRIFNTLS